MKGSTPGCRHVDAERLYRLPDCLILWLGSQERCQQEAGRADRIVLPWVERPTGTEPVDKKKNSSEASTSRPWSCTRKRARHHSPGYVAPLRYAALRLPTPPAQQCTGPAAARFCSAGVCRSKKPNSKHVEETRNRPALPILRKNLLRVPHSKLASLPLHKGQQIRVHHIGMRCTQPMRQPLVYLQRPVLQQLCR